MEPVSNTDKMIAAIDDALYHVQFGIHPITAYADLEAWLRFLRTELADERAAHNEHAAELCRLEKENARLRDKLQQIDGQRMDAVTLLQSIQQERDRVIEVTRHYADRRNHPPFWLFDDGQKARDVLREIGVREERTWPN